MARTKTIVEIIFSLLWIIIPLIAVIAAQLKKKQQRQKNKAESFFASPDTEETAPVFDENGLIDLEAILQQNAGAMKKRPPVPDANADEEFSAPQPDESTPPPPIFRQESREKKKAVVNSYADFIRGHKQKSIVVNEILSKPIALRDV